MLSHGEGDKVDERNVTARMLDYFLNLRRRRDKYSSADISPLCSITRELKPQCCFSY